MKRCPIAAKIAGSIGILAVLCIQQIFHIGVRRFVRFVRPLLVTTLCVWEIWSDSNNCLSMYHVVGKKK